MKILIISYDFPYPPAGGSISRDLNIFKELSKYNELHWVNRTIRGKVTEEQTRYMMKYFSKMKIIEWDYAQNSSEFFKSLFTRTPYIIRRFKSDEMKSAVDAMLKENEYDLILCDHLYLAQYLPDDIEKRIPVIPNNEDCGFSFYKKMSESSSLPRRIYAMTQWKKILNYEIELLKRFRVYITTSENEKKSIEKHYSKARIYAADNGVDTSYFNMRPTDDVQPSLIYTAWFGYYPNVEAVHYFANEIFPIIKKRIPDTKFYIVGKEPPESIRKLDNDGNIKVTGYVEDVREYLWKAGAAVVPLKVGGGTRLKILEAMSSGVPVISTRIGAEGIRATDGKDILLADNKNDFADKVCNVLSNKTLSAELSRNGRKLAEEHYDWAKIGKDLNDFLVSFVSESGEKND